MKHDFGLAAAVQHNNALHRFCVSCGAEERRENPGGPWGPYEVGVDADKFPTCEEARAEKARQDKAHADSARRHAERVSAIPRFHALEWVRIRGRGFVAIVECDKERDRNDSGLRGDVFIDDELFECTSVERNLPAFPIQPGEQIGLLVTEKES